MTTRKSAPPFITMEYNFKITEVMPVVKQAADDLAMLLHGRGVNVDNLVFLMGQEHHVGPMEMAETHFTNALDEQIPFIHFCNELPPRQFQPRLDEFKDDSSMVLYDAAEAFAKPLGTRKRFLGSDFSWESIDYIVTSFSIVNALRNNRQNHFIDLNKHHEENGGIYNIQTPDITYYHRYKNAKGPLGDTIQANRHLFSKQGKHACSIFGMTQRDLQMTGRIDDIMGPQEGPIVASVGLSHVHDCYKNKRPTLTDYLLCAGKDVVTLSFLTNHYGADYAETQANFFERMQEQASNYQTQGTNGTYHGHAKFRLA